MHTQKVVFDHTSHKILWQWLAQNPGKSRDEAFKALGLHIPPGYSKCYACLYAVQYNKMIGAERCYCECCPLFVTDFDISQVSKSVQDWCVDSAACLKGLHDAWEDSTEENNFDGAREVALIIANLSVCADVPTK